MAIQWRDQPILDSVQLPGSDTKYWVADSEAREKIETLIGATRFMGVTTTELEDGDTTNPITIDKKSYTAQTGDIVIYTPLTGSSLEFIWDGSKWQLLGGQAIEDLGALAYKNSASGSYTPEGSISIVSDTTTVITSVTHDFSVGVDFSSTEKAGYSEVPLGLSTRLDTNPISYFGSSQALKYINLASINNKNSSYTSIVTDIKFGSISAITNFTSGDLPTISNQNTVTVAMGTGSSSTTLIFNLSDIGFNPGTQPDVNYGAACAASDFTPGYATVSFLTLEPDTADIAYDVAIATSLYYSVELSGGLNIDTSSVLSGVTATFNGSASTITVS